MKTKKQSYLWSTIFSWIKKWKIIHSMIFIAVSIALITILPVYISYFIFVVGLGSLFFQSVFHHRYSAHQSIEMSKAMEKVMFLGSLLFQAASYLSPYVYGVMHRIHHAYVDTEMDPHSPRYDGNLFAMMWRTRLVYNQMLYQGTYNGEKIDEKFLKKLPKWKKFDKLANSLLVRILMGIITVVIYIGIAHYIDHIHTIWGWISVSIFIVLSLLIAPIHGAIVNWWGHRWGYTNYHVDNDSQNIGIEVVSATLMAFIIPGEHLHNNHHKLEGRWNFATAGKWWEYDMYAMVILPLLHIMKIIKLKQIPKNLSE